MTKKENNGKFLNFEPLLQRQGFFLLISETMKLSPLRPLPGKHAYAIFDLAKRNQSSCIQRGFGI
ncbi:hypothetical protein D3Z51_08165 [Clostridiaceae bacterium]|nr:hypothetical protein [Clostridiaceae bacterium]RKI14754.1 hypothetical protein D7V81_07970 [bacterium 1XD21-70]